MKDSFMIYFSVWYLKKEKKKSVALFFKSPCYQMITSLWSTVAAGRRLRPHCWTTGHTGRPPLHHEAAKTTLGAERLCNLCWWCGGWLSGMMDMRPMSMKSWCDHIFCGAVLTSTATLEHSSCWTSININMRCSWWANMTCLYKIWKLSITVTIESFHSCCVAPKPRGVLHRACCRLMCLLNHWWMEHTRHSFIFLFLFIAIAFCNGCMGTFWVANRAWLGPSFWLLYSAVYLLQHSTCAGKQTGPRHDQLSRRECRHSAALHRSVLYCAALCMSALHCTQLFSATKPYDAQLGCERRWGGCTVK